MSESKTTQSGGMGKQYSITVDGTVFHSALSQLTGAQVKSLAGVDPSYGLFLQGHGGAADRQLGDSEVIDISEPGREKLYSAPPATFGRH